MLYFTNVRLQQLLINTQHSFQAGPARNSVSEKTTTRDMFRRAPVSSPQCDRSHKLTSVPAQHLPRPRNTVEVSRLDFGFFYSTELIRPTMRNPTDFESTNKLPLIPRPSVRQVRDLPAGRAHISTQSVSEHFSKR